MAQYEMNIRDYWLIVRRRRFIIAVSTVLVAAFSFWFAKQKVPLYEASAAVKFEQSTSLSGLLVEVLSYTTADSIETQASLIKSYPILEEVARRMRRLPEATAGEAVRESRAYTAALDAIGGKLRTTRVPSTSILEVIATSANPREARDLANTVAEVYRDYNRTTRNSRIGEARKFIEAQLREVEGRVKRAEEEVWAFREANRIIAPGAESTVLLSVFTQLRGDIEKTRHQRSELELAHQRLARNDAVAGERVFVDSANPALQRLQSTQVELMLERNNLALEVTNRHPRLQALDDRMREVRSEMRREIGAQIALLRSREDILNRQMSELLQRNREVPAVELGLARLQRDAKVNEDLLTLLKTRHQEALIKESEGVEEVVLVRPATEPGSPIGGETLNSVMIGALLGLMLGLVLAFVQETLDTSIGTIEDVETYLQVPVLGIVPHIDARETVQRLIERRPALGDMDPEALQSHALLITHFDPKSPVAEAYRSLRTRVQFTLLEQQGKVLVVTSPTLQEGKTTTIVNLALTMAQNGQRTLLVGANLRRPSIHRFFGIEREPGLSDVLVGNARWRDCIRTVADILMGRFEMEDIMASPGLDNLHILESGPIPANPSELLSTPAMSQFLREVRTEYDVVLIDTPPVLPVTDSSIVAAQSDGVVLVYQAGKVGRLVLKRAKTHLESARAHVWGVVLNDVQTEIAGYAYTHYYTHYYGEETPVEPSQSRVARFVDLLRSLLGGAARPTAAPAVAPAPILDDGQISSSPRRSRVLLGGLLGLAALLGIGGLVGWQMGWLTPEMRPRDLFRLRLESSAPHASSQAAPALPPEPVDGATRPAMPEPSDSPVPAPPMASAPAGADKPASSEPDAGQRASGLPAPAMAATETPAASASPAVSAAAVETPAAALPAPAVASTTPSVTPASPNVAPPAPNVTSPAPAAASPASKGTSPAAAVAPASPKVASLGPSAPSAAPSAAMPPASAAATPAPGVAPRTPAAAPQAPAERFAVEFGPFVTAGEAERVERQLSDAGHQTVRFRQQTGAALYAVVIERVPSMRAAQALVAALREQDFPEAMVFGAASTHTVRVGEPLALRGAVQLAERLRGLGHTVRVAAQPGDAVAFVIRHGNFVARHEADEKAEELARLGLPNHVVRVR